MKTSRRGFLKVGCCAVGKLTAASALSRLGQINAMAQTGGPSDYRALVCIFLFGGNDANNVVVPMGSGYQAYASIRGALAVPSGDLLSVTTLQGAPYGLHPSLAAIHPFWADGRLGAVANVGMRVRPLTKQQYQQGTAPAPSNLYSHSDQTSQWQTAAPQGTLRTGWAGRIADRMQESGVNGSSSFPTGVSVSGGAQLLNGQSTQPATVQPGGAGTGLDGSDPSNPGAVARDVSLQEILMLDQGLAVVQAASANLKEGIRVAQLISGLSQSNPLATQFPGTDLGQQLATVAALIQARGELGMKRQIFFASIGGFDTHSNQVGTHDGLLGELGDAMAALYNATVEMAVADAVTTFTESEFSRTFQPSSGAGTDHAWGGHHVVLGGAVRGGNLYGTFPTLALDGPDDAGDRGAWIPTTSLDQYGGTLSTWFGVNSGDIASVFPNLPDFSPQDLGFMR